MGTRIFFAVLTMNGDHNNAHFNHFKGLVNLQITQNIAFKSLALINKTRAWTAIPSVLQSV